MAQAKKRGMNSVALYITSFLLAFVGILVAVLNQEDSSVFLIGCLVVVIAVVLFVLAMVQVGRDLRVVTAVKMGAAVKLNNMPSVPAPATVAAQLVQLESLHGSGSISDAEFAAAKSKLLDT